MSEKLQDLFLRVRRDKHLMQDRCEAFTRCVEFAATLLKEEKERTGLFQLRLLGPKFDDRHIEYVAEGLVRVRRFNQIFLMNCSFRESGAKILAKAIKENNESIEFIGISSCKLGEEGIKAITTALKGKEKSFGVHLDHVGMSNASASALASLLRSGAPLVFLSLSLAPDMDSRGIQELSRALRKSPFLEALSLQQVPISPFGMISLSDSLSSNTRLKDLVLDYCCIGDIGIIHLA
eukprot:CAMPEP_0118721682 /NCGR_PEP_ID=MMETSP0800-20121206/30882_1 /TAXON_ID=210618 ORGANISM="Striatella unipunctata, Strain CCMP2910" /NCGR_SAMPLE_ID=MMETSP0800 /ASSEMBLY_ACC=CAM_ASM_000638 /LENGTH=235 /DNA_ID=CAMNT_0006629621 /DNA_START=395 /DNA_END=1098 /DNA_ORIENTATION=-